MALTKKEIAALIARKTLQSKTGGFPNVSDHHKKSSNDRTVMYGSDYQANPEDKQLIDNIHGDSDADTIQSDLAGIESADGVDSYNFSGYLDEGVTNLETPPNVSQFINFDQSKTLVNPELANQVINTDVVELLPTSANRQQRITNAINELKVLLGPIPNFVNQGNNIFTWPTEPATDTETYWNTNYDISLIQTTGADDSDANITRLIESENNNNTNQSIESLRNLLNQYLKDIDSRATQDESSLPVYVPSGTGYAAVDGPNESIIVANETGGDMDFNTDEEVCDTFYDDGCPGCTNPESCNFDVTALTDDDSCDDGPEFECGDGSFVCEESDCPTE